jgi:hypothetical protein
VPTSPHRRPSLDDVWRWAPLIAIAGYLLALEAQPHDLWWHLRSGQLISEEGRIAGVDRFSFTRLGEPWVNQAWLMQLVLYDLYALGGLPFVLIGHTLLIVAGYALLATPLRRAHGTPAATLASVAAFLVGAMNVGVRPQSISFLCFGWLLAAIELHRQGRPRALRFAPLLFALWVNGHGAFMFGGMTLALYVLGRTWELRSHPGARRQIQELWLIGASACAALALNPEGVRGPIDYVMGFVLHGTALAAVQEFQPLQARERDGAVFFAVLAGSIAALWRSRVRPAPDQIAMLVAFGLAALYARRFAAWYGFVLAPVLAAALGTLIGRAPSKPGSRVRNGLYLGFAVALVVALPWLRAVQGHTIAGRHTPVAAMAELCRIAPDGARVLEDIGFASYQIFQCPRLPVFADSRIELYPQAQWDDYFAVAEGRFDWEVILERWGITYLFVPADDAIFRGLRAAVPHSERWTERYRDETAVIWSRSDPASN